MSQIPAVIDPRGAFVRKMIEDCGIPTFHIRANQKCVGVKINGKNRCLIEKNSFGLLKCAIPPPLDRRSGWLRQSIGHNLSAFLRRPSFVFPFAADADLFQKRLNRLFAAEEFLDRQCHVARIALLVNFMTQS